MMTGILLVHDSQIASARALAASVTVAGILQFLWMLWAVKRAGLTLRLRLPRLTGEVRELGRIILQATFGAGVYQLSPPPHPPLPPPPPTSPPSQLPYPPP